MKEKVMLTIKLFVIFVITSVESYGDILLFKNIGIFESKTISLAIGIFSAIIGILFIGFMLSAAIAQYKSDKKGKIYRAIITQKLKEDQKFTGKIKSSEDYENLPSQKFLREWDANKHVILQVHQKGI